MADDRFVLRRIAWTEIFPWLMIVRCFRISIGLPLLFLATLGALLMPIGEKTASFLLDSGIQSVDSYRSPSGKFDASARPLGLSASASEPTRTAWWQQGVSGVYWTFVQPVWRLFDRQASTSRFVHQLIVALWNISVWALFGGAITRVAVVKLGRDERISTVESLKHGLKNFGWYVAAPLFPLLGVALLLLPLAVVGLLLRFDVIVVLAGLVWPLALLLGLIMALLLLGLLGGWPLMWPTISAEERSDAFEAFNRSFSYTFQRPLWYLFYALVAVGLGQLSWILVDHFADAVIALNHWAISFGAGNGRVNEILGATENPSTSLWAGSRMIGWWDGFVRVIAQGFNYSYFFCAASAIYLLMRREVDQTDFDDVYVPDEASRYGLPPLRPGPDGVPEVGEAVPENEGQSA